MTTGGRRRLRIAILASPILLAIVGGIVLTRPPYAFAAGAELWLTQLNPSDPDEVWLFYAHPEKPPGIVYDARKELKADPTHEFRMLVPEGTRGSTPYDPLDGGAPVNFDPNLTKGKFVFTPAEPTPSPWPMPAPSQVCAVATTRASFYLGPTQVLIDSGNEKFLGSEMLHSTSAWPKDHTLIAIRKPANALEKMRAWIASIQWRGLPASAEDEVFKGLENDCRARETFLREMNEQRAEAYLEQQRIQAKRAKAGPGQAKLP